MNDFSHHSQVVRPEIPKGANQLLQDRVEEAAKRLSAMPSDYEAIAFHGFLGRLQAIVNPFTGESPTSERLVQALEDSVKYAEGRK